MFPVFIQVLFLLAQPLYQSLATKSTFSFNDLEERVTFVFHDRESIRTLRWVDSREFVYQGYMYDVISRKDSGEVTILECYMDKPESVFFGTTKSNKESNRETGLYSSVRLYSFNALFQTEKDTGSLFCSELFFNELPDILAKLTAQAPPTPPPKVIV
ncbi:MAG: hypothetical protein Kow00127_21810 [Bacteroidales bacterium]